MGIASFFNLCHLHKVYKKRKKEKNVLVFHLRVTVQSLKLPSPVKADKSEKALLFLLANESSAINIFVSLVVIRSYLCHKLSQACVWARTLACEDSRLASGGFQSEAAVFAGYENAWFQNEACGWNFERKTSVRLLSCLPKLPLCVSLPQN